MKKFCNFLFLSWLAVNVYGQSFSISSVSSSAMNSTKVEQEDSNDNCKFTYKSYKGFVGQQAAHPEFVVYDLPEMSASSIKSSLMTTLSTKFNSPKDAIKSISDNMIQIDGYASNVFNYKKYDGALDFSLVIQIKDNKIRFNCPNIKQLYGTNVPFVGTVKLETYNLDDDMELKIADFFNKLVKNLSENVKKNEDW